MSASGKVNRAANFIVLGEPASKANSRRAALIRGKPRFIKSEKALSYSDSFRLQVQPLTDLLSGDLSVTLTIHYASRRPDLDESLILDLMQGRIYLNDRQVKEKHVYWQLDPENPRTEITVRERGSMEEGADPGRQGRRKPQRKPKD